MEDGQRRQFCLMFKCLMFKSWQGWEEGRTDSELRSRKFKNNNDKNKHNKLLGVGARAMETVKELGPNVQHKRVQNVLREASR